SVDLSARVSDSPVKGVQARVIRTRQPCRTGAGLPTLTGPCVIAELARTGNRVPAPHALSCGRVVRVQKTARPKLAAGNADDDFVFDDQRSTRDAVTQHGIGDL